VVTWTTRFRFEPVIPGREARARNPNTIRLWGLWSPIHLLAIFTLVKLPIAVLHARRHNVKQHQLAVISIFCGALVIAGAFTVPGRIMHAVAFGP